MGNVASGCRGAAAKNASRKPGDPLVLSVVRTANWGMGSEEDVWQVELLGTATVKELKAKIQDLYDVPQQMQRLSLGNGEAEPALEDESQVEALLGKKVYLNPATIADVITGMTSSPEAQAAISQAQTALTGMMEGVMGAAREAQETDAALRESMQGVTIKVTFERPQEAGGKAAGKSIKLDLDALAQVEAVQTMVEMELFGDVGSEPAYLMFRGGMLPPYATLYDAGVVDGRTVTVAKERPPNPADMLLGMLANAGMAPPPGAAAPGGAAPGTPTATA